MYLAKFDESGRRTCTILIEDTEDKSQYVHDGYIEISDDDWNYYVGNYGNGENGTGYIRDMNTGHPVSAPPPTREQIKNGQLSELDAQYDADKAEIMQYYTEALFAGDTETQAELKIEMAEIDETYAEERKAIEEGSD